MYRWKVLKGLRGVNGTGSAAKMRGEAASEYWHPSSMMQTMDSTLANAVNRPFVYCKDVD